MPDTELAKRQAALKARTAHLMADVLKLADDYVVSLSAARTEAMGEAEQHLGKLGFVEAACAIHGLATGAQARSSMVEPVAHNGEVEGSSPSGPTPAALSAARAEAEIEKEGLLHSLSDAFDAIELAKETARAEAYEECAKWFDENTWPDARRTARQIRALAEAGQGGENG